MANARSIIEKAARKIHVLGRGQTLDADQVNAALETLNDMLGTLSMDVDYIFNNVRETFSLNGSQSYTIGSGGDFDTIRPVEIVAAYVSTGGVDYPLRQKNAPEYAGTAFKAITGVPDSFYYENNTPLGRIFLYPVGVGGYSLTLYTLKPLTSFADLTTDYSLPEGAVEMLVYNLAVRLCPDYEKPVPIDIEKMARSTLGNMQVYNKRHNYPTSQLDVVGGGGGNILGGWYVR